MLYETAHVRAEAFDGVATVWLDFPGAPANRPHLGGLREFAAAIDRVVANPSLELAVVRSAKEAGFCDGWDAEGLLELPSSAERLAFAREGEAILAKLARAPFASVAVVAGPCCGPGLDVILACDYRLAVATPSTRFALPACVPGWGGLSRLTRLIGPRAALDLALNGTVLSAREAAAIGLVDRAYCSRRAKIEPTAFLDELRAKPRKRGAARWGLRLEAWRAGRLARQAFGDVPAVAVVEAAARSLAEGVAAERAACAKVLGSPAGRVALELEARLPATVPRPLPAVVGVVGSTPWTENLARELAARGVRVLLRGDVPDWSALAAKLTPLEAERAAACVQTEAAWDDFAAAEWVVAAAGVSLPELESRMNAHARLLLVERPLAEEQALADRPERVLGSMLPAMGNFAELVCGAETSPTSAKLVAGWLQELGLGTVTVTDSLLTPERRVRAAVWDEAVRMVAEGAPIHAIDQAAGATCRPPLAAMDAFGLEAAHALVGRLKPLVAAGEGFYHRAPDNPPSPNVVAQVLLWDARCEGLARRGRAVPFEEEPTADELAERLRMRGLVAAASALAEERFAAPADLDFLWARAGFFTSHGGPLRFADMLGPAHVVARLGVLSARYGRRFAAPPELVRRAAAGEGFHEAAEPLPRRRAA